MAKRKRRRTRQAAEIEGGGNAYSAPDAGSSDDTERAARGVDRSSKSKSDKPEAVTDEELQSILKSDYESAVSYTESATQESREQGIKYYHAEPFGDEEEGRSQAVATEVRDTIRMMLPQVVEIFLGGERTVEFTPTGPEDVDAAELATHYVNHVVLELDNPGFEIFVSAFKDAMREKLGFVKWWWQQRVETTEETYEDITEAELGLLFSGDNPQEEIEPLSITMRVEQSAMGAGGLATGADLALPPGAAPAAPSDGGSAGPMPPPPNPVPMAAAPAALMAAPPQMPPAPGGQLPGAPMPAPMPPAEISFDVKLRRTIDRSYLALAAVPPEEMLIVPNSRDWRGGSTIIHKTIKTVSELVAMGYEWDEVVDLDADDEQLDSAEKQARDPASTGSIEAERHDPATKRVMYCEIWLRIDRDGDGIAELKRICTGGTELRVLHEDHCEQVNVAAFPVDPEPHTPWALSIADLTADLQYQKSHMWRAAIDSLANSVSPRLGFVEGKVNEADILSNENSSPIRMQAPGMIQPITMPFVGGDALAMMSYADDVREQRTGVTKAAAGLDPDTMQSTTLAAVNATISAAQTQIRMVARVFAEYGMKPLFRGILRTLKHHTVRARMVRLLGHWVTVDPRDWSDYDVSVDVALGRGSSTERIAALSQIAGKQEQIIATIGPENPLCGMAEYRYTLAKMVELAGFKDASRFFKPILPSEGQQANQGQQKPGEGDATAQALVQAETIKQESAQKQKIAELEADEKKASLELAQRTEQNIRDDDFRRDQLEVEAALKIAELRAKYGAQIDISMITALIDRDREQMRIAAQDRLERMRQTVAERTGAARNATAERIAAARSATAAQRSTVQ